MGDRCYMKVYVAREYVHLFQDMFVEDADTDGKPVAELFCEEANYAFSITTGADGFGDMPKGAPFYGWHGSGDNYGAGAFATDGVTMHFIECSFAGDPMVRVNKDGTVDAEDCRQAKLYFECLDAVRAQHDAIEAAANGQTQS